MAAALICVVVGYWPVERSSAAVEQRGDLRVAFGGGLDPTALPRVGRRPVGLSLRGNFSSAEGGTVPRLRRMSFALNRHGRLFDRGMPRCRRGQIANTQIGGAITNCGSALVGRGSAVVEVILPGQAPFRLISRAAIFNAHLRGARRGLFLYMQSNEPFSPYILDVRVGRTQGAFGTVLTTVMPADFAEVRLLNFSFTIRRLYRHRGQVRSYVSAGCPAPAGFPGAIFPLARATYAFDDGRSLTTTLTRACRARG